VARQPLHRIARAPLPTPAELRSRAGQALGTRFDLRDFPVEVVDNGSLPLDIPEQQVDAYTASAKR
jgi:uncharacterized protein (DUF885 family)